MDREVQKLLEVAEGGGRTIFVGATYRHARDVLREAWHSVRDDGKATINPRQSRLIFANGGEFRVESILSRSAFYGIEIDDYFVHEHAYETSKRVVVAETFSLLERSRSLGKARKEGKQC